MPRQKINERGEKTIMTGIILYKRKGGIFGAILSNLGNLEPFLNHFGTVFRHLEQFFGNLEDIFEVSVFRPPWPQKRPTKHPVRAIFFPHHSRLFCPFLGSLFNHFLTKFWTPLGVSLGVSWEPSRAS